MLRVFTLNIESRKHLNVFPKKINKYKPDVICLQEVFEVDLERIKKDLRMKRAYFVPNMIVKKMGIWMIPPKGVWGQAMLTNLDSTVVNHLVGGPKKVPIATDDPLCRQRILQLMKIKQDGMQYYVGSVHFTWGGEGGGVTSQQKQDYKNLMRIVEPSSNMLLCGDFNLHRGEVLWEKLSQEMVDNVSSEVESTLDPKLFRVANLKVVCDGFFTKGNHVAKNVEVVCGLSDHCGIVGDLTLKS